MSTKLVPIFLEFVPEGGRKAENSDLQILVDYIGIIAYHLTGVSAQKQRGELVQSFEALPALMPVSGTKSGADADLGVNESQAADAAGAATKHTLQSLELGPAFGHGFDQVYAPRLTAALKGLEPDAAKNLTVVFVVLDGASGGAPTLSYVINELSLSAEAETGPLWDRHESRKLSQSLHWTGYALDSTRMKTAVDFIKGLKKQGSITDVTKDGTLKVITIQPSKED